MADIETLKARARVIQNETGSKRNTASRVGGLLLDIIDSLSEAGAKPNNVDINVDTNGKLQLANRGAVDGMGYVILRQGSPLSSQFSQANTIYEVRYAHNLGGSTLVVPSGCMLRFNGGKIVNGVISGSILNDTIRSDWFESFDDFITSCNNLTGYSQINIVQGNYTANVGFVIPRSIAIMGNNSDITVAESVEVFIDFGELSDPTIIGHLTAAAAKGDMFVSVDNANIFKRGDILFLRDMTTSSFNHYRDYQEGEIVVVDYINGNNIYLSSPLFGTYKSENLSNCILYKHSMYRCLVSNLTLTSTQSRYYRTLWGIRGSYLFESRFENLTIKNFDVCVDFMASYNSNVNNCDFVSCQTCSSGSTQINQYGVICSNSQSITVSKIHGSCGNHICAIGGLYDSYHAIVSRRIVFDNCVGKSLRPSYPGINIHGDGEYVTIKNCKTNGIDVGGNYIKIENCSLSSDSAGRAIRINEVTGFNIEICRCTMNGTIYNSSALNSAEPNRVDEVSTFILDSCKVYDCSSIIPIRTTYNEKVRFLIRNNIIYGTGSEFSNLTNGMDANVNFVIEGNLFENFGFNFSKADTIEILNNNFYNTYSGQEVLRINQGSPANCIIIKGNTIKNSGTNYDFRFQTMGGPIPLFIFDGNYVQSSPNTNVSRDGTSSFATIFVFRNNIFNATKYFYICGDTVYCDTTPELGTKRMLFISANTILDGTLMNKSSACNEELGSKGTQGDYRLIRGLRHGNNSMRPSDVGAGSSYYNTAKNKTEWFDGTNWCDVDGEQSGILRSGTFAQRPTPTNVGFQYFNTTTKKVMVWDGTDWYYADGTQATA